MMGMVIQVFLKIAMLYVTEFCDPMFRRVLLSLLYDSMFYFATSLMQNVN